VFMDQYRRLTDLPKRIPVFPLRGVLLLPRATLPLNIFEPRYLAMIDEVMAGHRLLGMVQPAGSGDEDLGSGLLRRRHHLVQVGRRAMRTGFGRRK